MSNITEYTDVVKACCVDLLRSKVHQNFGEHPSSYVPRITGTAKGKERLGEVNDFAAYTAKTPFQVMVIDSQSIWSDTRDEDLRNSLCGKLRSRPTRTLSSREFSVQFYTTITTTWVL